MRTVTTTPQQHVSFDLDEQEEASDEEDRLIPPPQSWFGEEEEDEQQDFVAGNHGTIQQDSEQQQQLSPDSPETTTATKQQSQIAILPHPELAQISAVGAPQKAPSWKELSSQVLPAAAKELLSSSMRRIVHTARLSYSKGRWHRNYSDLGNPHAGYFRQDLTLPPFSSLPWIDRQLVQEWRTIGEAGEDDEEDFENARTLVPQTFKRKKWQKADICNNSSCRKPFGPTLLRHHCRLCGNSFCHTHSPQTHPLPHLGYDPLVKERVCLGCKHALQEQNLAERVAVGCPSRYVHCVICICSHYFFYQWRMARCRDYFDGELTPYFETGVDTIEDAALRIARAAITMARSVPLGAQAHVAVETVDVLRKYGLKGIYGLILRKEFLAAADLLCQACDINQATFPLSVHELSAAIFYALAQHRAVRGIQPEREHSIHALRRKEDQPEVQCESSTWTISRKQDVRMSEGQSLVDETDQYDPRSQSVTNLIALADAAIQAEKELESEPVADVSGRKVDSPEKSEDLHFRPVCDHVPDDVLSSCLLYAPIALNFIYVERHVDMQLLAAQQGWRILYSHLEQEPGSDRPGSALFLHDEKQIACFAVRGTATIHDVVTDIRQMPVQFPESESENSVEVDDWTPVLRGQGLAVCGMAKAAVNLFREHIDVLAALASKSYKIRIVGHSLGAGVATLLGTLVKRHLETNPSIGSQSSRQRSFVDNHDLLRVYGFASPSCVDAKLSDYLKSFVTTVVLHDDVVPRLTPTSIRGLVKHLLHIRETWVQIHLKDDIRALTERARTAWAPRWRSGFTLRDASGFCRKQLHYGKKKLLSVQGNISRQISSPSKAEPSVHSGSRGPPEETGNAPSITLDGGEDEYTCGEGVVSGSPKFVVEYMGGIDKRTDGTIIDGEEFFDTEDSLLEGEEDLSDKCLEAIGSLPQDEASESLPGDDSWTGCEEQTEPPEKQTASASFLSATDLEEVDDQSAAVMLDETPLPRMFLPGKIVHIYTHRGGYRAAFVPRTFRELRRISMAGNMLNDHTCKEYFEALKEVKSVRTAQEGLPQWTAFDEDDTCSCCASRFTWASTSDSQAQEARDKHNCRSCGTLCCDPCAKNRTPLPSIGLTVPVRVCDRCYNDIGGALSGLGWTNSLTEETREDLSVEIEYSNQEKTRLQERKRERRSLVVDDLASRIHSAVVVHN